MIHNYTNVLKGESRVSLFSKHYFTLKYNSLSLKVCIISHSRETISVLYMYYKKTPIQHIIHIIM